MVQGKFFGSFHLVAPVATNRCGTFFAFTYFWIALFEAVPSAEQKQHFIALDQLARLLNGFGRTVGIVIRDEIDLAAIDAAIVVYFSEYGRHRLADRAVGRGGAAIGNDVADLDLGVAGAGVVFLLRTCTAGGREHERGREQHRRRAQIADDGHSQTPKFRMIPRDAIAPGRPLPSYSRF